MCVDTVSISIPGVGKVNFLQYVTVHDDRCRVTVCALIGEFKLVLPLQAVCPAMIARQSYPAQRRRLIQKLQLLLSTGRA